MDRKDLKLEHYKQKVAELSVQYEDRVADLRVEVTILSEQVQEKDAEIERLKNELAETAPAQDPESTDDPN